MEPSAAATAAAPAVKPLPHGAQPVPYAVPAPAAAAAAEGTCYRCGYVLHGIADDQPCPECGLLAERSRRVSDELHDTRPRWLRRVSRGANLVLLAILLAASAPVISSVAESLVRSLAVISVVESLVRSSWIQAPAAMTWHRIPMLALLLMLDLAAIVLLKGAFMLSSPEGYAPADRADRRLRRSLRLAAAVPLVALGLLHAALELNSLALAPTWGRGFALAAIGVAAFVLGTLGTAPLPFLLFRQLRGLAKRARSAHLAEHCTIVGVGAALSFAYLGAVSFVMAYGTTVGLDRNWMNRSQGSLMMMLVMAVLVWLFLLWSLYLLIRFAVAFHRASRQLHGKWTRADRSVVAGLA